MTDDAQLIAALRGYAEWIRNYTRAPEIYTKPDVSDTLLDRAAERLETFTAAK
jgi:hypothetical protein